MISGLLLTTIRKRNIGPHNGVSCVRMRERERRFFAPQRKTLIQAGVLCCLWEK